MSSNASLKTESWWSKPPDGAWRGLRNLPWSCFHSPVTDTFIPDRSPSVIPCPMCIRRWFVETPYNYQYISTSFGRAASDDFILSQIGDQSSSIWSIIDYPFFRTQKGVQWLLLCALPILASFKISVLRMTRFYWTNHLDVTEKQWCARYFVESTLGTLWRLRGFPTSAGY